MESRCRPVRLIVLALCQVLSFGSLVFADTITWNFTGSGGYGNFGVPRTFTQNGITVTATAWGYTADLMGGTDNGFQIAGLGQWSTGLGVCNQSEGLQCGSPAHQVDNVGADDWVLFKFSTPVDPLSVRVDPYGTWDTDVSYWVGNVNPSLSLSNFMYSDLGGLGFGSRIDQNGPYTSNPLNVPITSPLVNALLFGTKIGGDPFSSASEKDRFKIASLTATVPEPSSFLLMGLGFAGLGLWSRKGQRSNRGRDS